MSLGLTELAQGAAGSQKRYGGSMSHNERIPGRTHLFYHGRNDETVPIWNQEQLGIALTPGIDEVSLALVADAWSRTYRSRAVTFSPTDGAQQTRNGIRIVPDQVAASWPAEQLVPAIGDRQPASALDDALHGITVRCSRPTADFVAMQLEYPRLGTSR